MNVAAIAGRLPVKRVALFAVIGAAVWGSLHESPATWNGYPAPKDPEQAEDDLPLPFTHKGFTVSPLAHYKITAVVLARARYRMDQGAGLAPVDLALGWGPMSRAETLNDLSISQSGRWYEYRWANEPPLEPEEIISHSANTHCLPADNVRNALLAVRRHELVTLDGYLVEVTDLNGFIWRSSLTRADSGAHACEVFWVKALRHQRL